MNNVDFTFHVQIPNRTERWTVMQALAATPSIHDLTYELAFHDTGIRWCGDANLLDQRANGDEIDELLSRFVWIRGDYDPQAGVRCWRTSTGANVRDELFAQLRPADFGIKPAPADPTGKALTHEQTNH